MRGLRPFALIAVVGTVATADMPVLAQASEPLELVPVAQWGLDYGDDACTLFRRYSSADGDVDLRIEQTGLGHFFSVTLASEQLSSGQGAVRVVIGPGAEERTWENPRRGRAGATSAVRFNDPLLPERPIDYLPAAEALQHYVLAEASITNLVVTNAFDRPVSFQLGSMRSAMTAMRSCIDDLLTSWGMDPAIALTATVPAVRIGQVGWARRIQEAYPRSMMRDGRNAILRVVLEIAAVGSVKHCHAHNPEPFPIFETTACEILLAHARYEPARDAAGNPVPTFDSMDVHFALGR